MFSFKSFIKQKKKGTTKNITIDKCSQDDYNLLFSKDNYSPLTFNEKLSKDLFCLGNRSLLVVEGSSEEETRSLINIEVHLNHNYLDKRELLGDLFAEERLKLHFYYNQPMYDVSNKDNPVFFKFTHFFNYLDLTTYKRNDLYLQEFVFAEDTNMFFDNYVIYKRILRRDILVHNY